MRVTCTSSSTQPVTPSDPATPIVPSAGVSNEPNGAAAVAVEIALRVTAIGPTPLTAPLRPIEIDPVCVAAMPAWNRTEMSSVVVPVPDVGDTTSQGTLGVAVQVTVPAPLWVM